MIAVAHITTELKSKLEVKAAKLGMAQADVIRMALDKFCSEVVA